MNILIAPLESPRFLDRVKQLGKASDITWALGTGVGLLLTIVAATLFRYPYSQSGKFWAYAGLLVRSSLYIRSSSRLKGRGGETLSRLFAMGMVAGLFEILVDWWLIHGLRNGRLEYMTGNDVVLLGSPIWMPVAWACVITELGYPAVRLFGIFKEKWARNKAVLVSSSICAVSAGVTVGFYEFFAYRAGWWKYHAAWAMIGGFCALYIPLGEALMFLPILPLAAVVIADDEHPVAAAIETGALFAVSIAVSYAFAYGLLEFGRFPR